MSAEDNFEEHLAGEGEDINSDMEILEEKIEIEDTNAGNDSIFKEIDLCEDDMLKQICYQILDHIEFEHVPNSERDALCRIIMNRGLMDMKEGRITSLTVFFQLDYVAVFCLLSPLHFF